MKKLSMLLRSIFYPLLWVLISLTAAGPASAQADDGRYVVREVTGVGEASLEQLTPEEARQMAMRNARANGIEKAAGTEIVSRTLVRDFSVAGDFIKALSRGFILNEEVAGWEEHIFKESADKPGILSYRVTLNLKVASLKGRRDPYFQLRTQLNRNFFIEGEEAVLKATPTRACYLNIVNLTSENRINLLFPNDYMKNNYLEENQTLVFPDRSMGNLVLSTTAGHRRDAEAFIVIATKQPFPLKTLLGQDEGIMVADFYRALLELPVAEWVEDIMPYEVRKN